MNSFTFSYAVKDQMNSGTIAQFSKSYAKPYDDTAINFYIPTKHLEAGEYVVDVQVKDDDTGEIVSKNTIFYVTRSPIDLEFVDYKNVLEMLAVVANRKEMKKLKKTLEDKSQSQHERRLALYQAYSQVGELQSFQNRKRYGISPESVAPIVAVLEKETDERIKNHLISALTGVINGGSSLGPAVPVLLKRLAEAEHILDEDKQRKVYNDVFDVLHQVRDPDALQEAVPCNLVCSPIAKMSAVCRSMPSDSRLTRGWPRPQPANVGPPRLTMARRTSRDRSRVHARSINGSNSFAAAFACGMVVSRRCAMPWTIDTVLPASTLNV